MIVVKYFRDTLKNIVFLGAFLMLVYMLIISMVRRPSYTIKTNGKLYIVNKLSSSITVFDLFEGKELKVISIAEGPREITALTNPESIVVTNYGSEKTVGKSISVINVSTNKVEKTIDIGESLRPFGIVALSQPHTVGVVTGRGNDFLAINTETGVIDKKIPTQQIASHRLVMNPNTQIAYVTNMISNSVTVIDLSINEVIKIIPCGMGTSGIAMTPDGTEIWVTNNRGKSISIINTNTYQIIQSIPTGKEALNLKFSVDGAFCLVANSGDGTISVYDRHMKKQIKTIRIPGKKGLLERALYHTPRPVGILVHPNGLYAFVANSNANKIEVIDMNTFSLVSTIGTANVPDAMALVE